MPEAELRLDKRTRDAADVRSRRRSSAVGALGGGCLTVAAVALGLVAALGPSAAEAPLGRGDNGGTPPLHAAAHPAAWLVTLLLTVAVVAGATAVGLVLAGRWRPDGRRLALGGFAVAAALSVLPPIASADPLSYAAYGRLATTGHDPWTTKPSSVDDPVTNAVETPWRDEPAVYGPLAVGEQAVASTIGGHDVALTVLVLDLAGAAAFVGAGLLLARSAADDDTRRRRAVLWSANPLLWLQLVAGAHVDVVVAAVAVAAVLAARRTPVGGAALAGVAGVIKPPGGLVWLAFAWAARRDPRRVARLVVAALAVVVPSYALAGSGAWHELSRAARRVSHATPWRPLVDVTHLDRAAVGPLALILAAFLVALLMRGTARDNVAMIAAVLTLGYVLAAPYALPWYDGLPWALLAIAIASWRDWVLLAHTTVLSLAYIPGRDAVKLTGAVHTLTDGMRSDVAPALLAALLVIVAATSLAASAGSRRSP